MWSRPSILAWFAAALVLVLPRTGLAQDRVLPGIDTMRVLQVNTFAHRRHESLPCLTCHEAHAQSRLKFVPPRGCQACHHQAPEENRCPSCHPREVTATPLPRVVTVTVRGKPPRPRTVGLRHQWHAALRCSGCHTQPVWLEPADSVLTCTGCHSDHHQAGRTCGICHNDSAAFAPHAPPAQAHAGCDACHATRTIERLVPERAMCLTCHPGRRDHEAGKECTPCHFQEEPAVYRRRLVSGGG